MLFLTGYNNCSDSKIYDVYFQYEICILLQATMPSSEKHPSTVPMWKGVKVSYTLIAMCLFPLTIGGYWAYGQLVSFYSVNVRMDSFKLITYTFHLHHILSDSIQWNVNRSIHVSLSRRSEISTSINKHVCYHQRSQLIPNLWNANN